MNKMIPVKFIKPKPPYNANEKAGFPERIAAGLVRKGYAQLVNENEIEIDSDPIKAPENAPEKSLLEKILDGSGKEIEAAIIEKENDDFLLTDSDLGKMVGMERTGKNRKGVIKALEGQIFERLGSDD